METTTLKIRLATKEDLEAVCQLYRQGSSFLHEQGVNQWINGYPNENTFLQDLKKQSVYVLETGQQLLGVATILCEVDPNYDVIYEGVWLNPANQYVVIHRITIDNRVKGQHLADWFIREAEKLALSHGFKSIRIDTHQDNLLMQKFLKRHSFQYCGIIELESKDKRLAFEKLMEE